MSTQLRPEPVSANYREDFAAWADAQADLLRARRFNDLDLSNLLEEVEGLSGSERSALESQVRRIILHLLKLRFSPATNPHRKWRETIINARSDISAIIRKSPSLDREVADVIAGSTTPAARLAIEVLELYRELTPEIERRIDAERFTREQVLEPWFPDP